MARKRGSGCLGIFLVLFVGGLFLLGSMPSSSKVSYGEAEAEPVLVSAGTVPAESFLNQTSKAAEANIPIEQAMTSPSPAEGGYFLLYAVLGLFFPLIAVNIYAKFNTGLLVLYFGLAVFIFFVFATPIAEATNVGANYHELAITGSLLGIAVGFIFVFPNACRIFSASLKG